MWCLNRDAGRRAVQHSRILESYSVFVTDSAAASKLNVHTALALFSSTMAELVKLASSPGAAKGPSVGGSNWHDRLTYRVHRGETLDQTNAELHRLTTPVSLDKTVGDDGDATLGDLMANGDGTPEDHVMTLVDSELLDELLHTLDARARFAVEARFGLVDGERKSFREVGEQLGVTAEAARRLVSRAVAGLRDDAERILAV